MKRKRIVLDVSPKLHTDIKKRAADQQISMKQFVIGAIIKRIMEEDHS